MFPRIVYKLFRSPLLCPSLVIDQFHGSLRNNVFGLAAPRSLLRGSAFAWPNEFRQHRSCGHSSNWWVLSGDETERRDTITVIANYTCLRSVKLELGQLGTYIMLSTSGKNYFFNWENLLVAYDWYGKKIDMNCAQCQNSTKLPIEASLYLFCTSSQILSMIDAQALMNVPITSLLQDHLCTLFFKREICSIPVWLLFLLSSLLSLPLLVPSTFL